MPKKKALVEAGPNDFIISLYDDDDFAGNLTYGRWREDKAGHYLLPEHLGGSNLSGGSIAKANFNAWQNRYGKGEDKWWTNATGGHGTFAVVIDIEKVPDKISEEVAETLASLYDYPLLDEEEHGKIELEAQEEAWDGWARREFKKLLEKKLSAQIDDKDNWREVDLDDVDDDKLYEVFDKARDKANVYWSEESDGGMYIDLARIVNKLSEADLNEVRKFFEISN